MGADPQKRKIYAWEDTFRSFGERTLTRAQARRCLRRLARRWKVPLPTVQFLRRDVKEWSSMTEDLMVVNYHHCNEAILAHEMAHYVTDRHYGPANIQGHGPEFFAIYLAMLEFLEVAPRIALEASAAAKGIKWTKEAI